MEKRFFYAFLITLIFFLLYSQFMSRYFPQQTVYQSDRKGHPSQSPEIFSTEELISEPISESEEDKSSRDQHIIGDFIITYSTIGGYIKEIAIGQPENILAFKNIGFVPQDKNKSFLARLQKNKILFEGPDGAAKEFNFDGNILEIKINSHALAPLILFSNILHNNELELRYQEFFYSQGNILKRIAAKKAKTSTYKNLEFAGIRDRYYCLSLLKGSYDVKLTSDARQTNFILVSPPSQIFLYLGLQTTANLKPYGLQGVMYYGFFHGIGMGMIKLLHFFYFLTKNWGLSIICLAIFIYFILFPFTSKSTKAMRKMQQVQPEIEELKKKYKDNTQKLQKETVELYRKYKINPLGGCLPLFFQVPVFIALYQVLFRFVELKGARFLWIKDLSLPDHLYKTSFPRPLEYINLLPILIVIIGLIQQKITTTIGAGSSHQQKSMGLFFAVFIGVIFYNFPSALVLYWFIQNLLTLWYQAKTVQFAPGHSEITP